MCHSLAVTFLDFLPFSCRLLQSHNKGSVNKYKEFYIVVQYECVCVCVCVFARVRACVHACMCVCMNMVCACAVYVVCMVCVYVLSMCNCLCYSDTVCKHAFLLFPCATVTLLVNVIFIFFCNFTYSSTKHHQPQQHHSSLHF